MLSTFGAASTSPLARTAFRPAFTSIVVGVGETLVTLANRWGTTVAVLMELNDLVNDRVTPGQRLKLPPAKGNQ